MRTAYITAGAAGMYCGSCMRDNILVAALRRIGVDSLLIPTYTPIRTDIDDQSESRIFLGGINIYLNQKVPFWNRLPRFMTRMFSSPALLRALSRLAIKNRPQELGDMTISILEGSRGVHAREVEELCDWLENEVRPDVVHLTNSLFAGLAPALKESLGVGVPVLCTLQGEDLFLDGLLEPFRGRALELIRRHASSIDCFIAVSEYYRGHMSGYLGIPAERIRTISPGIPVHLFQTDRFNGAQAAPGRPPTIGYFARICPEKGADVLLDAFAKLKAMPAGKSARLRLAGYLSPWDRRWLLERMAAAPIAAVAADIEILGTQDGPAKRRFFEEIDIFSVPTVYREPKALYVFEALASGLPAVLPDHGAFPEIIAATGGGLLVEPGSADALARGLHELLADAPKRRRLGEQGAREIAGRFTDRRMAEATMEVYRELLAH